MSNLVKSFLVIFVASFALLYIVHVLNTNEGYAGDNTIVVYNWGDYIDEELIERFEEETGYKIVYQTFDSNEAMLTKLKQGGTAFDVTVPSEYTIAKMLEEDLLQPIDHSKVPNLKYIDERFMDLSFDPGNQYSVPYFWGTVGVVFNPNMTDLTFESWEDLWDPSLKNDILLVDGAREIIGMGLNSLSYSLNDTNEEHLQEAFDKLSALTPNVKAIVGDEIKMLMQGNEAAAAVVWSGDASEMMWENEELDYKVPEEGSNLWFDNFVIPKSAQNLEGAHAFINFMLDPEVSAQNTEYVGYSTPNKAALEIMDEETANDERFYPSDELTAHLEVYDNLGPVMLSRYNELFLQFKMYRK